MPAAILFSLLANREIEPGMQRHRKKDLEKLGYHEHSRVNRVTPTWHRVANPELGSHRFLIHECSRSAFFTVPLSENLKSL
jgi:hypothetical protein